MKLINSRETIIIIEIEIWLNTHSYQNVKDFNKIFIKNSQLVSIIWITRKVASVTNNDINEQLAYLYRQLYLLNILENLVVT